MALLAAHERKEQGKREPRPCDDVHRPNW
jgi:hypothetical protein